MIHGAWHWISGEDWQQPHVSAVNAEQALIVAQYFSRTEAQRNERRARARLREANRWSHPGEHCVKGV